VISSNRHSSATITPTNRGNSRRIAGEVLGYGRGAADVDLHGRAAFGGWDHVLAEPFDQVGGGLVLR
jgi:hypothetical protein